MNQRLIFNVILKSDIKSVFQDILRTVLIKLILLLYAINYWYYTFILFRLTRSNFLL